MSESHSSETFRESDHKAWAENGLKDFGTYSECVTFCNQREDDADSLAGDWFYGDDDNLTIYYGTFGNDHSPGSSHNTRAEVYEGKAEYHEALKQWEDYPEFIEEEEESDVEVENGCRPDIVLYEPEYGGEG